MVKQVRLNRILRHETSELVTRRATVMSPIPPHLHPSPPRPLDTTVAAKRPFGSADRIEFEAARIGPGLAQ